jgi:serine/threonine-protein kinase RsbT
MADDAALRAGILPGDLVAGEGGGDSPVAVARRIPIANDLDIVAARVEGRNLAREMGFGIIDQARIATAISELARNVVLYAHGGEIVLSRVGADRAQPVERDALRRDGSPEVGTGLEIVCRDHGPGIADVEEVLSRQTGTDGSAGRDMNYGGRETTSGGGMGLSGTRQLMDEFQITSTVGVGTTVVARRWLR